MVGCRSAEVGHATEDHHASAHSSCANHGQAATAEVAIDANDGDDRCDEEPRATSTRKEEGRSIGIPELLTKHATQELNEKVDAGELLEELQHDWGVLISLAGGCERNKSYQRERNGAGYVLYPW